MSQPINVTVAADLTTSKAERQLQVFLRKAEASSLNLRINDRHFSQPLGRITGATNEFNKSLAASNARVLAFAASAGLMFTVQRGLVEIAKAAIQVEKSLTDINVILNVSKENLHKFGSELFSIANNTGQAFSTVAEAATEFSRQGLSMEKILLRTNDAMILTRLSGMSAASSVQALTAAMNTFSDAALTSTEIINKMANVDAAFAVSTNDLSEALKRVGSSAQDAGVSFDELLAMVATAQQMTARGGAVIGNSLKSIFTRIQRTEVLEQLQLLGVAVKGARGEMLPAISIMSNLAQTMDKLSEAQKSQITEMMGGVFQINIVKAVLGDLGKKYSIYQNALDTANDSTDEAIKRNERLNETLDTLVNKTFQNVKKAAAAIGQLAIAPALERVLEKTNLGLEFLMGDPKEASGMGDKIGKGIVEGLGKFISGPGLIMIAGLLFKLSGTFSKFALGALKDFFGLNKAASERLQIEKFVNKELQHNTDLLKKIEAGEISVSNASKQILKNIEARIAAQTRYNHTLSDTVSLVMAGGGMAQRLVQNDPTSPWGVTSIKAKKRSPFSQPLPGASQGYVPNLVKHELSSASYATHNTRAIIDNLPGIGPHVRNSKETLAYHPSFQAPFINPPKGSTEGIRHRAKSKKELGIDPYSLSQVSASTGMIPNFAKSGLGWSRSDEMPEDFRRKFPLSQAQMTAGRMYSPDVRKMLRNLLDGSGKLDRNLLDKLIARDIPIQEIIPASSSLDLPNRRALTKALKDNQTNRVQKLSEIPAGSKIDIRQDVPSMINHGVGVVKTEGPRGVTSYDPFVVIDDPRMMPDNIKKNPKTGLTRKENLEKTSLKIGAGGEKVPLLKISGLLSKDQSLPKDLQDWSQVGFNPDRHSYYYDRKTGEPVTSGDKAVQVGNTVFMKHPQYGRKEDFTYSKGFVPNFVSGDSSGFAPNFAIKYLDPYTIEFGSKSPVAFYKKNPDYIGTKATLYRTGIESKSKNNLPKQERGWVIHHPTTREEKNTKFETIEDTLKHIKNIYGKEVYNSLMSSDIKRLQRGGPRSRLRQSEFPFVAQVESLNPTIPKDLRKKLLESKSRSVIKDVDPILRQSGDFSENLARSFNQRFPALTAIQQPVSPEEAIKMLSFKLAQPHKSFEHYLAYSRDHRRMNAWHLPYSVRKDHKPFLDRLSRIKARAGTGGRVIESEFGNLSMAPKKSYERRGYYSFPFFEGFEQDTGKAIEEALKSYRASNPDVSEARAKLSVVPQMIRGREEYYQRFHRVDMKNAEKRTPLANRIRWKKMGISTPGRFLGERFTDSALGLTGLRSAEAIATEFNIGTPFADLSGKINLTRKQFKDIHMLGISPFESLKREGFPVSTKKEAHQFLTSGITQDGPDSVMRSNSPRGFVKWKTDGWKNLPKSIRQALESGHSPAPKNGAILDWLIHHKDSQKFDETQIIFGAAGQRREFRFSDPEILDQFSPADLVNGPKTSVDHAVEALNNRKALENQDIIKAEIRAQGKGKLPTPKQFQRLHPKFKVLDSLRLMDEEGRSQKNCLTCDRNGRMYAKAVKDGKSLIVSGGNSSIELDIRKIREGQVGLHQFKGLDNTPLGGEQLEELREYVKWVGLTPNFSFGFTPNFASYGNRQVDGNSSLALSTVDRIFKQTPQLKEDLGGQTKAATLAKGALKGQGLLLSETGQKDLGENLRTNYGKRGGLASGGFIPNFAFGSLYPKPGSNHNKFRHKTESGDLRHRIQRAKELAAARFDPATLPKDYQEIFLDTFNKGNPFQVVKRAEKFGLVNSNPPNRKVSAHVPSEAGQRYIEEFFKRIPSTYILRGHREGSLPGMATGRNTPMSDIAKRTFSDISVPGIQPRLPRSSKIPKRTLGIDSIKELEQIFQNNSGSNRQGWSSFTSSLEVARRFASSGISMSSKSSQDVSDYLLGRLNAPIQGRSAHETSRISFLPTKVLNKEQVQEFIKGYRALGPAENKEHIALAALINARNQYPIGFDYNKWEKLSPSMPAPKLSRSLLPPYLKPEPFEELYSPAVSDREREIGVMGSVKQFEKAMSLKQFREKHPDLLLEMLKKEYGDSKHFPPEFLKNKGFIPNYSNPNRIRESKQSGLPIDQTYMSFVNTPRYTGPVVGNRRDEPTQQALRAAVMSHPDPANAGRIMSDGFIPGFAKRQGPQNLDRMRASVGAIDVRVEAWANSLKQMAQDGGAFSQALGKARAALSKLSSSIKSEDASIINLSTQEKGLAAALAKRKSDLSKSHADIGAQTIRQQDRSASAAGQEFRAALKTSKNDELKEDLSKSKTRRSPDNMAKTHEIRTSMTRDIESAAKREATMVTSGAKSVAEARKGLVAAIRDIEAGYRKEGKLRTNSALTDSQVGKIASSALPAQGNKALTNTAQRLLKATNQAEPGITSAEKALSAKTTERSEAERNRNLTRPQKLIEKSVAKTTAIDAQKDVDKNLKQQAALEKRITFQQRAREVIVGKMEKVNQRYSPERLGSFASVVPFSQERKDFKVLRDASRQGVAAPGLSIPETRARFDQVRTERNQRFQSAAMTASFVAPMLASSISNTMKEDNFKGKAVAEGIGDVAMFGGMGAQFGRNAGIAGVVVGGVLALDKYLNADFQNTMHNVRKASEKAGEKLNHFQNATQSYIQGVANWAQELEKTNVDPQKAEKRRLEMEAAMLDIPKEFQSKIKMAGTDMDRLKDTFEEIRKNLAMTAKQIEIAASNFTIIDRETGGTLGGIRKALDLGDANRLFESTGDEPTDIKRRELLRSDFQNSLFQSLDKSRFVGDEGLKRAQQLETVAGGGVKNAGQIVDFVEREMGPQAALVFLDRLEASKEDFSVLANMLQEIGRTIQHGNNQSKETIRLIREERNVKLRLADSQKLLAETSKFTAKEINSLTSVLQNRMKMLTDIDVRGASETRDSVMSVARGRLSVVNPFIDEDTKINQEGLLDLKKIEHKSMSDFESQRGKLVLGVLSTVTSQFDRLVQESQSSVTASPDQAQLDPERRKKRALSGELLGVTQMIAKQFSNDIDQGQLSDPIKLSESIKAELEKLVSSGKINESMQALIERDMSNLIESNRDDLIRIADELRQQKNEATLQTSIQREIANNTKMLESFGGIQSFLGQDKSIDNILQNYESRVFSRLSGTSQEKGRVDLELLNIIRNVSGGDISDMPSDLRQRAVESRTQNIKDQINVLLRATPEMMTDQYGGDSARQFLSGLDPEKIAEKQIAGLLKDDPGEMLSNIHAALKALPEKTLTKESAQQAFEQALIGVHGQKSAIIADPLRRIEALLAGEKQLEGYVKAEKEAFLVESKKNQSGMIANEQLHKMRSLFVKTMGDLGAISKKEGKESFNIPLIKDLSGGPSDVKDFRFLSRSPIGEDATFKHRFLTVDDLNSLSADDPDAIIAFRQMVNILQNMERIGGRRTNEEMEGASLGSIKSIDFKNQPELVKSILTGKRFNQKSYSSMATEHSDYTGRSNEAMPDWLQFTAPFERHFNDLFHTLITELDIANSSKAKDKDFSKVDNTLKKLSTHLTGIGKYQINGVPNEDSALALINRMLIELSLRSQSGAESRADSLDQIFSNLRDVSENANSKSRDFATLANNFTALNKEAGLARTGLNKLAESFFQVTDSMQAKSIVGTQRELAEAASVNLRKRLKGALEAEVGEHKVPTSSFLMPSFSSSDRVTNINRTAYNKQSPGESFAIDEKTTTSTNLSQTYGKKNLNRKDGIDLLAKLAEERALVQTLGIQAGDTGESGIRSRKELAKLGVTGTTPTEVQKSANERAKELESNMKALINAIYPSQGKTKMEELMSEFSHLGDVFGLLDFAFKKFAPTAAGGRVPKGNTPINALTGPVPSGGLDSQKGAVFDTPVAEAAGAGVANANKVITQAQIDTAIGRVRAAKTAHEDQVLSGLPPFSISIAPPRANLQGGALAEPFNQTEGFRRVFGRDFTHELSPKDARIPKGMDSIGEKLFRTLNSSGRQGGRTMEESSFMKAIETTASQHGIGERELRDSLTVNGKILDSSQGGKLKFPDQGLAQTQEIYKDQGLSIVQSLVKNAAKIQEDAIASLNKAFEMSRQNSINQLAVEVKKESEELSKLAEDFKLLHGSPPDKDSKAESERLSAKAAISDQMGAKNASLVKKKEQIELLRKQAAAQSSVQLPDRFYKFFTRNKKPATNVDPALKPYSDQKDQVLRNLMADVMNTVPPDLQGEPGADFEDNKEMVKSRDIYEKIVAEINKEFENIMDQSKKGGSSKSLTSSALKSLSFVGDRGRAEAGQIGFSSLQGQADALLTERMANGTATDKDLQNYLETFSKRNKIDEDNLRKDSLRDIGQKYSPGLMKTAFTSGNQIFSELIGFKLSGQEIKELTQSYMDFTTLEKAYLNNVGERSRVVSAARNHFEKMVTATGLSKGLENTDSDEQINKAYQTALSQTFAPRKPRDLTTQNQRATLDAAIFLSSDETKKFETLNRASIDRTQGLGLTQGTGEQLDKLQASENIILSKAPNKFNAAALIKVREEIFRLLSESGENDVETQKRYKAALQAQFSLEGRGVESTASLSARMLSASSNFTETEFTDYEKRVGAQTDSLRDKFNKGEISRKSFEMAAEGILAYEQVAIDFLNGRATSSQLMSAADRRLGTMRETGGDTGEAFREAVKSRVGRYGKNESTIALQDITLKTIDSFESNLGDAFTNAITGAKKVKDAFKDMADAMLNEITKMSIQAATRALMGGLGLGEFSKGGLVKKFARGGLVTGGSGVKDDVPALLNRGEFVVRRSSVNKFGSGLFQALNDNQNIQRFASGGSVGFNPLEIENQKPSSSFVSISGSGNSTSPTNPEEPKKSTIDPQAGLVSQINHSANSADIILRNAFVYDHDQHPTLGGSRLEIDDRLSRQALSDTENPQNQFRMKKQQGLMNYLQDVERDKEAHAEAMEAYYDAKQARWRQAGINVLLSLGLGYHAKANSKESMSGPNFRTPKFMKNSSGGLNGKDDIPALLTAGEYVMSRDSVMRYGSSTFEKLNSGRYPERFAQGGIVGDSPISGETGLGGAGANNINITVNIDQGSRVSANVDSEKSSNTSLEGQQNAREFSRKIEQAVVKVILDQKRQGGILSS